MKNLKNTTANFKTFYFILLCIGFLFFSTVSYYLLDNAFRLEYVQLVPLLLGLFFGVFAIVSIYAIATVKHYEIRDNKLIIKSISKKIIRIIGLEEIISYNEIEKSNKYSSWNDLTVFTKDDEIRISSNLINNYDKLKYYLTADKRRNDYSKQIWLYRDSLRYGIGFVVFSITILSFLFYAQFWNDVSVTNYQLQTVEGRTKEPVKLLAKNADESFNITLKEYPDFSFKLSDVNFYYTNPNELVLNLRKNDLIVLEILSSTYNKKIAKIEDLSFLKKTINYSYIKAYSLKINEQTYKVAEKDYSNNSSINLELLVIYFSLVGILFYGIYLISLPKPIKNNH